MAKKRKNPPVGCPTCKAACHDLDDEQLADMRLFGECEKCRHKPLTGTSRGESPADDHDRKYHGGQFGAGEW